MLNRNAILGLAMTGLFWTFPATQSVTLADAPAAAMVRLISLDEKPEADNEKNDKKGEEHEGKEKKEVPTGTITEAELEVKKGTIMYGFDVKDGNMVYDINITVDGKFFSKKVDDDKDEKDEKEEKPAKPGPGSKM